MSTDWVLVDPPQRGHIPRFISFVIRKLTNSCLMVYTLWQLLTYLRVPAGHRPRVLAFALSCIKVGMPETVLHHHNVLLFWSFSGHQLSHLYYIHHLWLHALHVLLALCEFSVSILFLIHGLTSALFTIAGLIKLGRISVLSWSHILVDYAHLLNRNLPIPVMVILEGTWRPERGCTNMKKVCTTLIRN